MEKPMRFFHKSVLLDKCVEGLQIRPDGCYLDGTVGGAGHSAEIAKRLTSGCLFCLDKDPDALEVSRSRLKKFSCVRVLEGDFRNASSILPFGQKLDGALLDLGVSSYQLDSAERGFSYQEDGELDMRMSRSGLSAADIVNEYSREELISILYEYGEERYAVRIADRIIKTRESAPILSTKQLSDIVLSSVPPSERRKQKHPAKKTFQALRIAVNDELGALKDGLEDIFDMLNSGGRFCVITFHSLEDRIVKQYFKKITTACTCPPEYPVCVCGGKAKAISITKKPIVASEEEQEENRRSRSAKLRIAEKL